MGERSGRPAGGPLAAAPIFHRDRTTPVDGCELHVTTSMDWEFEDPATRIRHVSPIGRKRLIVRVMRGGELSAWGSLFADEVPGLVAVERPTGPRLG